jgi:hypothetical protein
MSVYAALSTRGELHAEEPTPSGLKLTLAVHPTLELSTLKERDLTMIFSGRRRTWPGSNQPVQLILLPNGSPEMQWLCKQLNMPEHLVRRFIYRRVYQGTMRNPLEVNTTEEAIKALQMNPGSLAPLLLTLEQQKRLAEGGSLAGMIRLVNITP